MKTVNVVNHNDLQTGPSGLGFL